MVNTYVSISSMKSEKDTWIELEKIRTDPTISKDLIKISKIISHDLDYELFVDFLSSFNRELFVTPTVIAKLISGIAKEKSQKELLNYAQAWQYI